MIKIDKRFTTQENHIIIDVLDAIYKNGDGDQLLPHIEIKKSLQLTSAAGNCRVNFRNQSAIIKVNANIKFKENDFIEVVAHELLHAFKSALRDAHSGNWAKFASKYSNILGVKITQYIEEGYILSQIREKRRARQEKKIKNKQLWELIYTKALEQARKQLAGRYSDESIISMAEQAAEDLYKKYA